jgi:hypothetical protein
MRSNRLGGVAIASAVAILLGCSSAATNADDAKPGDAPPADQKQDQKKDEKAPAKTDENAAKAAKAAKEQKEKEEKDADEKRRFNATVTDKTGTVPFLVSDAQIFVPEVSLLGGEGGKLAKELVVKHGPAEITIPLKDVTSLKVDALKEDRLEVTVRFKDPALAGSELKGTIKSNLQLHGKYLKSSLDAKLKLRDVDLVTLEEVPAPPK